MTTEAPLLQLEITVDATPQEVWKALTEPARLQCWFPLKSAGDQNLGGKVLLSWGADCEWETNITAFEPQRHLQWMDALPDAADPGAILPMVDWTLESVSGGTRLRLVQSGFDPDSDWQDYFDALRRGWTYFLDMLVCYVEHHFGQDRQMIYRRGRALVPRAQLWSGLLGALGMGITASEGLSEAGSWIDTSLGSQQTPLQIRLIEAPYVFAGRLPQLNQASLFIELEGSDNLPTCGVWLSTFDLPDDQRAQLDQQLQQICAGLLEQSGS